MMDSATGATDLNWVLMSLHYWGENAIGSWRLTLQNSQLRNRNTGQLGASRPKIGNKKGGERGKK